MANSTTSLADKRTLAHDLFMRTDKSFKEIARMVGVNNNTVGDWARNGKWKEIKAANSITRSQVINNTLMQIAELQGEINTRPVKYPTAKESDTMVKLSNLIRDLDKSLSLADYVSMMEELLKWLHQVNPATAKLLAPLLLEFAQTKAKQITG